MDEALKSRDAKKVQSILTDMVVTCSSAYDLVLSDWPVPPFTETQMWEELDYWNNIRNEVVGQKCIEATVMAKRVLEKLEFFISTI
jgi:hypothetical protein